MTKKTIFVFGIALLVLGIILGAFGAHALKEILTAKELSSFETGVRYQIYHGIALLALSANGISSGKNKKPGLLLMVIGVILFSVSIYFLSLQSVFEMNLKWLGLITPIGGLLMILGWLLYGINVFKTWDDE
jgi:uncharacterized membrane protein YgdD (TMEM256/DUF423 family)